MLEDQVLIRYDGVKEEAATNSLIVKPQTRYEVKCRGTVLAVGLGRKYALRDDCGCHKRPAEWVRVPVDVQAGDRVLFEMGAGTLLDDQYPGQRLLNCTTGQIVAVLPPEDEAVVVVGDSDVRPGVRLFSTAKLTGHA